MYTPRPIAPIIAIVKMSSQVAFNHCPKVGLVLYDGTPWDLDAVVRGFSRWAPVAVVVSGAIGAAAPRLKRPMVILAVAWYEESMAAL